MNSSLIDFYTVSLYVNSNKFYLSNDFVIWPKKLQEDLFKKWLVTWFASVFGFPLWGIYKAVIAEDIYNYNFFSEFGLLEMSQSGAPKTVGFTTTVIVETVFNKWGLTLKQGGKGQGRMLKAYVNPPLKLHKNKLSVLDQDEQNLSEKDHNHSFLWKCHLFLVDLCLSLLCQTGPKKAEKLPGKGGN